jgi:hypothetical protein
MGTRLEKSVREVVEGVQTQGTDEKVTYSINTTNWGVTAPTSPSMVVKAMSTGTDVTATVTTGSMSVSGAVITLKPIFGLSVGEGYRVEVQFTGGGFDPGECFLIIKCET